MEECRLRAIRDPPCEKVFDHTSFAHLAKGKSGTVVITARKIGLPTIYALKIINLTDASGREHERLRREIEINGRIRHTNIVEVFEVYKNDAEQECTMVMELMEGGDLFDRVIKRSSYDEVEARPVVMGILKAVKYLHSHKIAHRDLKPENVVFDKGGVPKLIDFGFAKQQAHSSILETPIGTPYYVAPEVQTEDSYSLSVDMWSIGSIVYFMLFRKPPFFEKSQEDQQGGKVEFPSNIPVSQEVKEFIINLLQPQPIKRMTAAEALIHPWFSSHLQGSGTLDEVLDVNTVAQMREDLDKTFAEERDTESHTKGKICLVPARETPLWKKRVSRTGVKL